MSIAMLRQKSSLLVVGSGVYTTNWYGIHLPLTSTCICRSIKVRGRWNTPQFRTLFRWDLSLQNAYMVPWQGFRKSASIRSLSNTCRWRGSRKITTCSWKTHCGAVLKSAGELCKQKETLLKIGHQDEGTKAFEAWKWGASLFLRGRLLWASEEANTWGLEMMMLAGDTPCVSAPSFSSGGGGGRPEDFAFNIGRVGAFFKKGGRSLEQKTLSSLKTRLRKGVSIHCV